MRDGHRVIKHGLNLPERRHMAARLRALAEQLATLRQAVQEAYADGHTPTS